MSLRSEYHEDYDALPRRVDGFLILNRVFCWVLAGVPFFIVLFSLSALFHEYIVPVLHGQLVFDYVTTVFFVLGFLSLNVLTPYLYWNMTLWFDPDKYARESKIRQMHLVSSNILLAVVFGFAYLVSLWWGTQLLLFFFVFHTIFTVIVTQYILDAFTSPVHGLISLYSIVLSLLFLSFWWIFLFFADPLFFLSLFLPSAWVIQSLCGICLEYLNYRVFQTSGTLLFLMHEVYPADAEQAPAKEHIWA